MGRRRISTVNWGPGHARKSLHFIRCSVAVSSLQKQGKGLSDYRSTAICYLLGLHPGSGLKLLTARVVLSLLKS
jgi:hypothetical protein